MFRLCFFIPVQPHHPHSFSCLASAVMPTKHCSRQTDIEFFLIYRTPDLGTLFKPYFSIIIIITTININILLLLFSPSFFVQWFLLQTVSFWRQSLGLNIYSENTQDTSSNIRTFENPDYHWLQWISWSTNYLVVPVAKYWNMYLVYVIIRKTEKTPGKLEK